MALVAASVGNGGTRYRPLILDRVETMEGEVVHQNLPQVAGKIPASPRTLSIVQQGLWSAVNGERGTASRARLKDIEVAGKTGTSQVIGRKEGGDDYLPPHLRPHAWFVCYAPAGSPRIAVAVLIENGEHGSSAAGPIVREMVKTYLRKTPAGGRVSNDAVQVLAGNG
jgi:penicillin-binding protein 2